MRHFLFFILFTFACFCAFADTDVSGSQSGTWNLAGSPYNVIGDITIPPGSDLLIQPGVQVVVMGDYQITAEGTLTATGTEADSIFFHNGQAIPEALWGGIRLENEAQMSNIQFCYLEKAEIGVNSINSPCNISYNRFTLNEKAIQLYGIGDPDPATVQVDYNIVEYSIQNGILVTQNSNAVIQNNEIRYNGTGTQYRGAIQLSNQSQGGSCSPLIQNNHIHHNLKQGITAWDIYGDNGIHPQILNNMIENNLTGIYLLNSSGYVADNIIRHNFIIGDANSGAGVMVAGGTSEPYFERNEIYGNFTGFYLGNNAQPCLGNLSIYHDWAQGENEIYDNIDESNILHSVYCYSYTDSGLTISAENNYWGTDDPVEIAQGINDHNDNASLPTVDFEPYLTGQDETVVNGSVVYNGVFTLTNYRIQFVSHATGDVFQEYDLDPGQPFSFSLDLPEEFHVVVLADAEGTDQTQFGSPGGLLDPTVFYPDPTDPINVGVIEIQDTLPPRYQEVGAPMDIEGQLCHPVYNSFFVYHWEYINW
ncbi:MAG: right-handed parallel beta-helix repeat-containing protein, partial [Candidatus Syntrophosphaera sp.]